MIKQNWLFCILLALVHVVLTQESESEVPQYRPSIDLGYTLLTMGGILAGIGILIVIHMITIRRDEPRYFVYEWSPLLKSEKILPPPPSYEQVI